MLWFGAKHRKEALMQPPTASVDADPPRVPHHLPHCEREIRSVPRAPPATVKIIPEAKSARPSEAFSARANKKIFARSFKPTSSPQNAISELKPPHVTEETQVQHGCFQFGKGSAPKSDGRREMRSDASWGRHRVCEEVTAYGFGDLGMFPSPARARLRGHRVKST